MKLREVTPTQTVQVAQNAVQLHLERLEVMVALVLVRPQPEGEGGESEVSCLRLESLHDLIENAMGWVCPNSKCDIETVQYGL